MVNRLVFEETVGDDDKLVIHLPTEDFRGKVKVIIESENVEDQQGVNYSEEDEAAFFAELNAYFSDPTAARGLGLTSDEIARSPEVGAWADRADITDSVEFVNKLRREKRERRLKRD